MKKCLPIRVKDDWEKLDETSLSKKEDFYSHLNGRCSWCGLHEQKKPRVYNDFEYIYNEK